MNHANPDLMRAKARQATDYLKDRIVKTGAIEPLVALMFHDHIEQVEFEDSSILEHFDLKTAKNFDYVRSMVSIKRPQATMITLDVRMGLLESEEVDAVADTNAILVVLESALATIQVIVPYTRAGNQINLLREEFTEATNEEEQIPCSMFRLFSKASVC